MTDQTVPTEPGPLSVDQAVASLMAPPEPEHEEAAPVEAAAEPEQEIEAEPNPAETTSEAEEPGDGEEAAELTVAEAEPVKAPQWWDAEAAAEFAKLTPEAQSVVFAQEAKREAITAKAKQEAADVRREADHQVAQVQQIVAGLNDLVPKALETFKSRWDVDWKATIAEHGAEQTLIWQAEMEAEKAQLQQLTAAKAEAERLSHQAFLQAEAEKLKGTELEKPELRNEVGKYLVETGIEPEALTRISASELTIAHKAMLWDRAQAALKAKPPAPKPVAPVKAAVRPAAASQSSSEQRNATQIANRYAQTRSVDDAVALLLAKGTH